MKTTTIFGFYSPPSSSKLSFLSSLVSSVSTRKCLPELTQLEYSFVISYSGETRIEGYQGGRSWQPFGEGKNGHTNFWQTRIYYFATNALFFLRNCKFAYLTQYNMQYIPCKSALLAKEALFLSKKALFMPKDLQKKCINRDKS